MNPELKVGDRVKSKLFVGKKKVNNAVGTIIATNVSALSPVVCVEFDKNIGGHNGKGFGKRGRCWHCLSYMLERIEDKE